MKKQIPTFIMMFMGFLSLSGYFINNKILKGFVDNDANQWYMIIAGFAAFLGVINLLQIHLKKVAYKKNNWQYSIFTLLGFISMIIFGFLYNNTDSIMGAHLKDESSYFYWMFNYIYLPLASTMFALLAFFVASASYRAFKIRNFEATLLLISGVLLMIGRVPIGQIIPWWIVLIIYTSLLFALSGSLFQDKKVFVISYILTNIVFLVIGCFYFKWNVLNTPPFLSIPLIQEWIIDVPATAGSRAIMIGIALGTIAQSFRIITGRERSILGD